MKTALTELLDIKYPIISGAMANISDSDLVSAVSNAGGLGVLQTGGSNAEEIKALVEETQAKTDKPFAVNLFLMNPNLDEIVDYLTSDSGVKVVTTGAGSPRAYMKKFKEAGIKVLPVIASVAHARSMERIGADAVIFEGMEAGGHIGRLTTMSTLPQVVDSVSIPVVAAGGIGDGRGFAAALMLGACGVQMGTRFLVSDECNIHDNYKEAVLKAKDISTDVTGEMAGHPVRVLKNNMVREYKNIEEKLMRQEDPDMEELEEVTRGSLTKAVQGDVENGSMMAGQIAGLVNKRQTVSEIIEEVIQEAGEIYRDRAVYFAD